MLAVAGEPELPPLVQVPLGPLAVSLVKVVVYLRFLARPVVPPFLPPLPPPVTQSLNLPKGRPGCASAPLGLVSVLRTTVLQPVSSTHTCALSISLPGEEEFFPLHTAMLTGGTVTVDSAGPPAGPRFVAARLLDLTAAGSSAS